MPRRSPAVTVLVAGLAILVVGLVMVVFPGPGLLVALAGAGTMAVGLALLMAEHRDDDADEPTVPPDVH